MAASATGLGIGIRLASGAPPVSAVMKPPASTMRSKADAVDHQVLDDREGGGPPRLDHDLVAVGELPHVELAGGRALLRAVGLAVDHQRARAADALAAVVVEDDRLLALVDEALVDEVEHLEERHLVVDARGRDDVEVPGGVRARPGARPCRVRLSRQVTATCSSGRRGGRSRTRGVPRGGSGLPASPVHSQAAT